MTEEAMTFTVFKLGQVGLSQALYVTFSSVLIDNKTQIKYQVGVSTNILMHISIEYFTNTWHQYI